MEGRCVWCASADALTREHLLPRSRGGRGNANVAPACTVCNHERGSQAPIAYVRARARQHPAYRPPLDLDAALARLAEQGNRDERAWAAKQARLLAAWRVDVARFDRLVAQE